MGRPARAGWRGAPGSSAPIGEQAHHLAPLISPDSTSLTWLSSPNLTRWPELDKETVQERLNFDLVTRKLLACLEPVVMAEQVN